MMLADLSRMLPNPDPNRFMIGPTNEYSWSYSTITVTWSTVFAGVLPAIGTAVCVVIWAHIEFFTIAPPHGADRPVQSARLQIADRAVLSFRGGVASRLQYAKPGAFSRGVGDALVALKHEPEIDDAEDHDQEQRQRQREFDDGLAALIRAASRC